MWWAQPSATIVAGLLALAGAALAFWAVQRQIRSAAAEQARNRENDHALARRAERLAVLAEASEIAHTLRHQAGHVRAIKQNDLESGQDSAERIAELRREDHQLQTGLVAAKLRVFGLADASESLMALRADAFAVVYDMWKVGDEWTVDAREAAVIEALQAALDADSAALPSTARRERNVDGGKTGS